MQQKCLKSDIMFTCCWNKWPVNQWCLFFWKTECKTPLLGQPIFKGHVIFPLLNLLFNLCINEIINRMLQLVPPAYLLLVCKPLSAYVCVSLSVCLPVKWGEAELSFLLHHVSTAPQSQKSLVVAGQIVHEFWIDPFGFYELEIVFATSRVSDCHGG